MLRQRVLLNRSRISLTLSSLASVTPSKTSSPSLAVYLTSFPLKQLMLAKRLLMQEVRLAQLLLKEPPTLDSQWQLVPRIYRTQLAAVADERSGKPYVSFFFILRLN